MSEQKIPAEMLDAATRAVGEYLTSLCIDDVDELAIAEVALRAAGVPALLARITELEAELARHQESEFHPDWSLLEATRASLREHQEIIQSRDARIAQLEAANIKLRAEIEVLETENAALEDELSEYPE